MTKQVAYTKTAIKALAKMPRPTTQRIIAKVKQYAADPASLAANVKKLQGSDLLRLRVGDYRVIFTETLTVVTVEKVGVRGDIYD